MSKVMTVTLHDRKNLSWVPAVVYEIHMLNPREHFPRFGGSRHDLVVGRTASMVVRKHHLASDVIDDTEYDIHEPTIWAWIAKLIREDSDGVIVETHMPSP